MPWLADYITAMTVSTDFKSMNGDPAFVAFNVHFPDFSSFVFEFSLMPVVTRLFACAV